MSEPVIRVEQLGKWYRLGQLEPYRTLRDTIMQGVKERLISRSSATGLDGVAVGSPRGRDHIWALRNVSFEVWEGEVVGIIGPNGAGKSTLLKVLSRITEPTEGFAEVRGTVGSLLEVGTGFHPELTGRENIFLNGAILGMRKAEIEAKFDEIVSFAELVDFMDTPVKRYSSGMQVRLAFAVAAHLEQEILLVDEVLSVGDAAFQKKSLGRMEKVSREGRSVLFVSHNMGAIRGLCDRAIWLDKGQIRADGDVRETITNYLDAVAKGSVNGQGGRRDLVTVRKVVLRNSLGQATLNFRMGEDLTVELNYHAARRIDKPYFWIGIGNKYGSTIAANMLHDDNRPNHIEGEGVLSCTFKSIPLLPQQYWVRFGARAGDGRSQLCESRDVAFFMVDGNMRDYGFTGALADTISWHSAPVIVPYEWTLPDGEVRAVNPKGVSSGRH